MDFIINKLKQLREKDRQLRSWIQSRPVVLTTGRCFILGLYAGMLVKAAWERDAINVFLVCVLLALAIVPMLWEPSNGKGWWRFGGGNDDEPDDGPDSPTGDAADRWLRSRTAAQS